MKCNHEMLSKERTFLKHSSSSCSCCRKLASFRFTVILCRWVTSFEGVNRREKGVELSKLSKCESICPFYLILYSFVYLLNPVDVWSFPFVYIEGLCRVLEEVNAPFVIFLKPSERSNTLLATKLSCRCFPKELEIIIRIFIMEFSKPKQVIKNQCLESLLKLFCTEEANITGEG